MTAIEDQKQQRLVLESQVRKNRDEVRKDLQALDDKLQPEHLKEQARAKVGEALSDVKEGAMQTGREFLHGASESARSNPLPALLVGAGIGYWIFDSMKRSRDKRPTVSSRTAELPRAAREVGHRASHYGQATKDRTVSLYRDNPLAFAGLCLVAGAGIGFALPPSRREDEWVGAYRDELWKRSKEEAARARDIGERAAHEALRAAEQKARSREVTPEDLDRRAAQVDSDGEESLTAGLERAKRSLQRQAYIQQQRAWQQSPPRPHGTRIRPPRARITEGHGAPRGEVGGAPKDGVHPRTSGRRASRGRAPRRKSLVKEQDVSEQ